jgi:hypothetical protein
MKGILPAAKPAGKQGSPKGKSEKVKDTGPVLPLKLNGEKRSVPVADLLDPQKAGALEKECSKGDKPVIAFLDDLLELPDKERWDVLNFIAGLPQYRIAVGEDRYDDLFEATLALMVGHTDMGLFKNGKMAALEAALLLYAEALDGACARVTKRLRELGVKGVRTADLVRDANKIQKSLVKGAVAAEAGLQKSVRDGLPDAPVAPDILVPPGWKVCSAGVTRVAGENAGPGVSAPVVITERGRDVHRGTESVTLAWYRAGGWHSAVVDRKVTANARSIVDLAGSGLPVTSNNARTLVQFLDDYEAANLDSLPLVGVTHKMGWQGDDGKDGFLWGRTLITAKASSGGNGPSPKIRYRGSDQGGEQLADGFHQVGTFEGWVEEAKPLAKYPRALLALYTSFVPPLLPILKSPNFVLDFSGPTSLGKTTVLRAAASVWGNPDERSQAAALSTWNSTDTWRERAPAVLNHLPFILDETKHVRHPEEVAKTIYAVVGGRGRGRGTVQGIAHQDTCQTVLFSCGEQPATSFTPDGGTRPRALTSWGSPFGVTSKKIGKLVRRLNAGIAANYGHAGPRFVRFLLKYRSWWPQHQVTYGHWLKAYEDRAGDNAVASRMAAHFAAIVTASQLVHIALDLPWAWADPIDPLWEELTQEAGEADQAAVALRAVMSWAYAHQEHFYRLHKPDKDQPHDGWAGRWDIEGLGANPNPNASKKWPWVGFMPHLLERLLKEAKHVPDAVVRTWRHEEWLVIDSEASGTVRNQHRAKVGRGVVRLYAIKREAVEEVMG